MIKMKKNNVIDSELSSSPQREYFGEKKTLWRLFEQGGFGGVGVSPEQIKTINDKITKGEIEKKRQKNLESDFEKKYQIYKVPSPNSFNLSTIALPIGTSVSFFQGNEDLKKIYFRSWEGTQYSSQIPQDNQLPKTQPQTLRTFVTPDKKWFKLNLVRKDNGNWAFQWFYDTENQPFEQSEYIDIEIPEKYQEKEETWWEKWGGWTLTALSVAAAALIPGMQGLLISAAIDMIIVVDALSKDDNVGALISALLAFAPFLSVSIKGLGRFSSEEIKTIASKFARAETEAEVKAIYKKLSDNDKILVRGVMSQDPKKLLNIINENIWKVYEENLKRGTWRAKDVVDALNNLIRSKKLTMPEVAKWWQKNPNLTKFGIDLGTSGLVLAGTYPLVKKQAEKKSQQDLENKLKQQFAEKPRVMSKQELEDLKNTFWEEDTEQ